MVSGVFFVAALYQNQPPSVYFPAPIDQDSDLLLSWVVGSGTAGGFDVNNLIAPINDLPLGLISTFHGIPGNWLLRAHGVASPIPPGVPLASIWIIIAAFGMGGAAFFKFRRK